MTAIKEFFIDFKDAYLDLDFYYKIVFWVFAFLIATAGFVVVDQLSGESRFETVIVIDKDYKEAHTTYSTDADGNMTRYHHPARYMLRLQIVDGWDTDPFVIQVSHGEYQKAVMDSVMEIKVLYGGITNFKY